MRILSPTIGMKAIWYPNPTPIFSLHGRPALVVVCTVCSLNLLTIELEKWSGLMKARDRKKSGTCVSLSK